MLFDIRVRINTAAEYQRGEVWSQPQQQLLIDSLLRGFDLPKIFLRKLPDGSEYLFDVIDGVQRLTSIWRFLGDEFPLPRSYSYPDLGAVGGRRWSELPQDARDRLEFSKITVTEIETESEDDIRELFQRLQKGEPLNAAERRNALTGPVRSFVAERLSTHDLWPETGMKNRRFAWHELSAIVLALVVNGGATGLKGADLLALYEDEDFDPDGDDATLSLALLDRLHQVAQVERGVIRTRWGLVDLALSLMQLESEPGELEPRAVMEFFKSFEEERKAGAAELADLRSTVIELAFDEDVQPDDLDLPSVEPDMLSYLNAFTREGASSANVETRASVMASRLRRFMRDRAR